MSLIYKLKSKLGYDVTKEYTREFPLYHYTIEHTDDSKSEVFANGYKRDESFLLFWKYSTVGKVKRDHRGDPSTLAGEIWPERNLTRELGSVKEIHKEVHYHSRFETVIDKRDNSIVRSQLVAGVDRDE